MPLKKLNKEQRLAATTSFGKNLIIASAGTGKTSTIVARIAYLLENKVPANKILLLTFTNKAAQEMIERLKSYFPLSLVSQITAGTFHKVSYSLLKAKNSKIVLKQNNELKILLKSLVEKRKFHQLGDIKAYSAAYLYDLYSLYQNSNQNEDFVTWFSRNYEEQAIYANVYDDVLKEFEDEKNKFAYVGFNDLLIKMKEQNHKEGRLVFDEILVDEYQDTNTLQGELIDSFESKSLFCVGDFDQSIYAFNGANIEIIGGFSKKYKDAQVYSLNINYRSSSSILNLANKVIKNNPRLYDKKLIVSREGEFKNPSLLIYNELFEQYNSIAQKISCSKNKLEDIAIIFRNNVSADGIEVALKTLNIASKRKGSSSFFDSVEVKLMIDIISILLNPKDIMAFINVLSYVKGTGAAMSKELFDAFFALGEGNIVKGFLRPNSQVKIFKKSVRNHQLGLFDDEFINIFKKEQLTFVDKEFLQNPIFTYKKMNLDLARFLNELFIFFKFARFQKSSFDLLSALYSSKIYKNLALEIAKKRATTKSGKIDEEHKNRALENIFKKAFILVELAKKYDDVCKFYNFLTLGSKEISQSSGVNLLTVHASKGLEFNEVYVIDLAQNRFPNIKLMNGAIEEERRLFYVAVTRAKDELYLSYAKYDKSKKIEYKPSQFLIEAGMLREEKA